MNMVVEQRGLNRKIILSDSINGNTAREVMQRILDINDNDDDREAKEKDYKVKPIELIINSPGGSIYDGFGLIDIINRSQTPVYTYCFGKAMSMGFTIYLSGQKRFVGKYSTFMYHDASTFTGGTTEQFKRTTKEMERLIKQYDGIVLEKTNILQEKLDDIKDKVDNWFIGAQEAFKLGIAHEIL